MNPTRRRVLILVQPLLLAGLEIAHPQPDVNVQAVMAVSTWFAAFHFIQLALIGLVALSAMLLANSYGQAHTWTTRLGIRKTGLASVRMTLSPASGWGLP